MAEHVVVEDGRVGSQHGRFRFLRCAEIEPADGQPQPELHLEALLHDAHLAGELIGTGHQVAVQDEGAGLDDVAGQGVLQHPERGGGPDGARAVQQGNLEVLTAHGTTVTIDREGAPVHQVQRRTRYRRRGADPGKQDDAKQRPPHSRPRFFMIFSISRFSVRSCSVRRLSTVFLPRHSPSSTFTRPLGLK